MPSLLTMKPSGYTATSRFELIPAIGGFPRRRQRAQPTFGSKTAKMIAGLAILLCLGGAGRAFGADWVVIPAENLREWSDPGKWWRIENGVFVAESEGGNNLPKFHFLEWSGSTGRDFELSLEYRIKADAPQDAGIYFRVERQRQNNSGRIAGLQAELDTAYLYSDKEVGKPSYSSRNSKAFGHIADGKRRYMFRRNRSSTVQPNGKITSKPLPSAFDPRKVFREPPAWNHCLIRAVGDEVQLFLNGVPANEIRDRDPRRRSNGDGIVLQYRPNNAYRFEVRDLKFREIKNAVAPGPERSAGSTIEDSVRLAVAGKPADAALIQERIFATDPASMDTMGGLGLAILYAATGDKEKHRRVCEKLFHKYAKPNNPAESERPAKAYVLFPGADDPQLLRAADEASKRGLKAARGPVRTWYELSRGIVDYRMGDFSAAARMLGRPSAAKHAGQRSLGLAYGAMVAFRLEDLEKANRLLADAERAMKQAESTGLNWQDVVAARVAIAEAKKLIR